jgi:hypothetical protein
MPTNIVKKKINGSKKRTQKITAGGFFKFTKNKKKVKQPAKQHYDMVYNLYKIQGYNNSKKLSPRKLKKLENYISKIGETELGKSAIEVHKKGRERGQYKLQPYTLKYGPLNDVEVKKINEELEILRNPKTLEELSQINTKTKEEKRLKNISSAIQNELEKQRRKRIGLPSIDEEKLKASARVAVSRLEIGRQIRKYNATQQFNEGIISKEKRNSIISNANKPISKEEKNRVYNEKYAELLNQYYNEKDALDFDYSSIMKRKDSIPIDYSSNGSSEGRNYGYIDVEP